MIFWSNPCFKVIIQSSLKGFGSCRIGNVRSLSAISSSGAELQPFSKEDHDEFMSLFPQIVKDVTQNEEYSQIPDAMKRVTASLHYNVPTRRKISGLATVMNYKMLEKPNLLTEENLKLANIVGWCTEMLFCSTLVYDDIMDNSLTRNGIPCWFRKEEIGMVAICDSAIIQMSLFIVLKKYFSSHPFYISMMESFVKASWDVAFGQTMETLSEDQISMEMYNNMAWYKGNHLIYIPTLSAMYLSKTYSESLHRKLRPLLVDLTIYHQIQNDIDDCYGIQDENGESGTDIEEGKYTWLYIAALQKGNPSQRKLIKDHYGKSDVESVKTIRNLYETLGILDQFKYLKEERFKASRSKCKELENPHRDLMLKLTEKVFKRAG